MQQIIRGRSGADNHIRIAHCLVETLQGGGLPTQFLGQRLGAFVGSVSNYQVGNPGGGQGPAGQFARFTGAYKQHPLLRQVAQQSVDETDAHVADGTAAIVTQVGAQVGIVVHPPAHPQGLVKKAGQGPLDITGARLGVAGAAEGCPYLAKDFPLAHHHGVQAAGNPEEVPDAIALLTMVEKRRQVCFGQAGVAGQEPP